jgi:glutamate 5-kinase
MKTKIEAARIATESGSEMVIASGRHLHPLQRINDGGPGTWFHSNQTKHNAKKRWIAGGLHSTGTVQIDSGALLALESGKSLLPAGVVDVLGAFDQEATVDVIDSAGTVFARGMVSLDSDRLRTVAGRQTRDLPTGVTHEVIHRDDLVVLPTGT